MNILIVGGPGSFTDKLIQKLKKDGHRIYLLTGQRNQDAHYARVFERYDFPYDSNCVRNVFESVNPDVTIYLGAFDTNFDLTTFDDASKFSSGVTNLLLTFAEMKRGRFIYLSSDRVYNTTHAEDIGEEEPADASDAVGLILGQAENSFIQWAKNRSSDIVVLRLDHLAIFPADIHEVRDEWCEMTIEALKTGKITCRNGSTVSLLSEQDALEYIKTIMKCSSHNSYIYNLSSGQTVTEMEMAEMIYSALDLEASLTIQNEQQTKRRVLSNRYYASEFGQRVFVSTADQVKQIATHIKQYKQLFINGEGKKNWLEETFGRFGTFFKAIFPYIENLIMFIPFFMLNNRAVGSRYFEKLDFYLLYVLLFAIVHGQSQAVFSSVLAVAGYCFRQMYNRSGFDVAMDYNTYIWIAQLFIVGLTLGHMHDQNMQLRNEAKEEKIYLSEQIVDIEEINGTNVRVKNTLETQLINQQDSLGKVYSITSALDQYHPEEVLFYAAETLSKLMECNDVTIYIISSDVYARMFTATSAEARKLGNSLRYMELGVMSEDIVNHRVYINKKMDPKYPMMASGVFEGERLLMIAMLWNMPWQSMTLGKANMLAVTCSLIQMSSSRATRYINALKGQRYIGKTKVLFEDAFVSLLNAYKQAKTRHLTEYTLLKVLNDEKDVDLLEMDGEKMAQAVRNTDYIGSISNDKLYVLLSNTTEKEAKFVMDRFENIGIHCCIMEYIEK